MIPAEIGRLLRQVRSRLGIPALAVEIHAVAAGMAEYAVQHHPDAQPSGGSAEALKILLRAQDRIDFGVVRRVVPVVRMSLKNGVQIETGDMEGF